MALCTKLVQWLSVGGLFIAVWLALLAEVLPVKLTPQLYEVILPVSFSLSHTHTHIMCKCSPTDIASIYDQSMSLP